MSRPDEEDSGEVLLAEATVGPDGTFGLSVNMQRTEEEDAEPQQQADGSSVLGDVAGAIGTAVGTAAIVVGKVASGLLDAATSGERSDEADE